MLPLTLVVCVIILTISAGISIILAKELYFSKLTRQSKVAYYAADNGLMCALMIDDHYVDPATGIGIFPYNNLVTTQSVLDKINAERVERGYAAITLNSIKCATSEIFNTTVSGYAVSPFTYINPEGGQEVGQTATFSMRMDLGDSTYRCTKVSVNKTSSYRQIISRGFASCDTAGLTPVERAVVNTSEGAGSGSGAPSGVVEDTFALTSGTSWTVPTGVTRIKVWAIGAGGGGSGARANFAYSGVGGGGGAGGTAYREFTVTPGQVLNYTLGTAGPGGVGPDDGVDGGNTVFTVASVPIRGWGGKGGKYGSGLQGTGGSATGGSSNRQGGDGAGISNYTGGGGGGAIGGDDGEAQLCAGGDGGTSSNMSNLFASLAILEYPTTAAGAGYICQFNRNEGTQDGASATGFGSGGGGAGSNGGSGGAGLYGGGGGGATGSTVGVNETGGAGGAGIVIISTK